MIILGIETSSQICSVALGDEKGVIDVMEQNVPRAHARLLPGMAADLLARNNTTVADLDGLAVSIGPGSFTGLRIGLSFAKGLAYSHALPIIPVPTMNALIQGYHGPLEEHISVLIHSHGNTLFHQKFHYQNDKLSSTEPEVITSDSLDIRSDCILIHWQCAPFINATTGVEVQPSARWIVTLAINHYTEWKADKPFTLVPNYISPFVLGGGK